MHFSGTPHGRLRRLSATHPAAALLWTGATTALAVSIMLDSGHIGRFGLFLACIAVVVSTRDLARHVVTRTAHVISLYEEDVRLDDDEPPDCGTVDISHARRRRDSAAARRTVT